MKNLGVMGSCRKIYTVPRCTRRQGVGNLAYWEVLAYSLRQHGGVTHCGAGRQHVFFDQAAGQHG